MTLLTLSYESLEDVAQDLDLVLQSTTEQEWRWQAEEGSQQQEVWGRFVADPSSVSTQDDQMVLNGLAARVHVSNDIVLSFHLTSQTGPRKATVDLSAPKLSPERVQELKDLLTTRTKHWKDEGIESLYFFDLFTAAQGYAGDLVARSTTIVDEVNTDLASKTDALDLGVDNKATPQNREHETEAEARHPKIELSRALFWSHHLKAPSKLKDFNNWCPELSVWGVLRVGWPGYLCFEGESHQIDEMIRRVKSLQWHAIQLRIHDSWTFDPSQSTNNDDDYGKNKDRNKSGMDPVSQALLSCPFAQHHPANIENTNTETNAPATKVRTGCEILDSMGEIVERLRKCGMQEQELSEALGLRLSTSTSSNTANGK